MTARTSGGLISHLGFKVGGFPFCKSRMACSIVTPDNTMGYQICKRCEKRFQKMQELKKRKEAKASTAGDTTLSNGTRSLRSLSGSFDTNYQGEGY